MRMKLFLVLGLSCVCSSLPRNFRPQQEDLVARTQDRRQEGWNKVYRAYSNPEQVQLAPQQRTRRQPQPENFQQRPLRPVQRPRQEERRQEERKFQERPRKEERNFQKEVRRNFRPVMEGDNEVEEMQMKFQPGPEEVKIQRPRPAAAERRRDDVGSRPAPEFVDRNFDTASAEARIDFGGPAEQRDIESAVHAGAAAYNGGSYANPQRLSFQIHGQDGPHSYRYGYDTGVGYNRQFKYEERDNYGVLHGRYGYYDQAGKLQIVNYTADPKKGFHAEGDHVPKPGY